MNGPYRNIDDAVKCLLYWQRRALVAEGEVEDCLDYEEFLLTEYVKLQKEYFEMEIAKNYFKQQFLDKENEIRFILGRKPILEEDMGTEEEDDPWKYRS